MLSELRNISDAERQLYTAAITTCAEWVKSKQYCIKDAVEKLISVYAQLGTITDLEKLKRVLYQEVTQESSQHHVIKSVEVRNRHWWNNFKADIEKPKKYWTRYYDYLSQKPGWSIVSVKDMDSDRKSVV